MERGTTLFLKIAVLIIGAPVMALGIYGLIWLATHPANPDYAHMLYPILLGIYACTIPFYIALYHAFKLLNYIDQNKAFSSIFCESIKEDQNLCDHYQCFSCCNHAICLPFGR